MVLLQSRAPKIKTVTKPTQSVKGQCARASKNLYLARNHASLVRKIIFVFILFVGVGGGGVGALFQSFSINWNNCCADISKKSIKCRVYLSRSFATRYIFSSVSS